MMIRLSPWILILLLSGMTSTGFASEHNRPGRHDIEQLLAASGSLEIGRQMSDMFVAQLSTVLKKGRPDLPPRMFDILSEEVNQIIAEHLPAFVQSLVPVYEKHFSPEEIRQLLNFYRSPVGKKSLRVLPAIMQESMLLGQQWGKSLAPDIQQRLLQRFEAEGIDLNQS